MLAAVVALSLLAPQGELKLSEVPSDTDLMQLLWEHSAELQLARGKVGQARGDLDRAHLLPNPGLDFSVNTIPVGPLNTANDGPLQPSDTLNYAVAVSELVELGKRGPRQDSFRRAFDAAIYDARELLRQRFYDLQEHLGEIAAAQARVGELQNVADSAHNMSTIQKARSDRGEAVPLDADRTLLEEEKLVSAVGLEQEHLITELRACTELLGVPCEPFKDVAQALAFLERDPNTENVKLEDRPDVQSLVAQEDSARSLQTLSSRRAIPDPTLRVGYVRDQFIASGNQQNSLYVGISFPLPFFDHGQADARAAATQAEAVSRSRQRTLDAARLGITRITEQARTIETRRKQVQERALPLARDVVSRLEQAVARGGVPVQDLLFARRTLAELLIDARDLDLEAFRNGVSLARAMGVAPPAPAELSIDSGG